MCIDRIKDKVFRTAGGEEYGVIRALQGNLPIDLNKLLEPFAEDSCGNYFVLRAGFVYFWDHETGDTTFLAASIDQFIEALVAPTPVKLREGQVKSAWINPEFAKKLGLKKGAE